MNAAVAAQHPVPENLKTANEVAEWEIAGQMTTASALDARLLGVLAFMAAVGGLLLTITHGFASNRWILFVGAASASAWLLLGLLIAADLESGPSAAKFYEEHGTKAEVEFDAQLLADFGDTVRKNKEKIDTRRAFFSLAILWAGLWAIVFGLVRAVS